MLEDEECDAHDTISRLQRELRNTRALLEKAQKRQQIVLSDDHDIFNRELSPLSDFEDRYVH